MTQFFSTRNAWTVLAIAALVIFCGLSAAAADPAPAPVHYQANAVTCVAGCRDTPPQTVATSTVLPTDPLPPPRRYDNNLVLRDVWCGDQGSCIALNHVAPPRLRDWDSDTYITRNYIAVFQVHQ